MAGLVATATPGGGGHTAVTATGGRAATQSSDSASDTTSTTASTPSTAPAPTTPRPRASVPPAGEGGTYSGPPVTDPNIGSAADIGPHPIEQRDPAPCVPFAQLPADGIVVLDPAAGCGRVIARHDEFLRPGISWSPDGTWLVASVNGDVTRIAADGSWRQDLGGGNEVESVALSPDGTRLAIIGQVPCCYLSQKRQVIVANSDGTDARVAQDDVGNIARPPAWSRDSKHFAYVESQTPSPPSEVQYLVVVDADGTMRAQRSFAGQGAMNLQTGQREAALIGAPDWTPDGLVHATTIIESPSERYLSWFDADLHDVDGPSNPDAVAFDDATPSSPDGGRLLYQAYDRDHGNSATLVYQLDRATGASKEILANAISPSWSPDGARFTYGVTDPSSQEPWAATAVAIGDLSGHSTMLWTPASVPSSCYCWLNEAPVWSPDGTYIAVFAQ